MFRTSVCALFALAVAAGVSLADDAPKKKKKPAGASGQIAAVDADKGTVTVEVKVKKATQKKTFKVTDKTAVAEGTGKKKVELTAAKVAEMLRKEQFKVGASVTVEPAENDPETAKAITFVAAKKKAAGGTAGTLSAVDAAKGTVTIKVQVKKNVEDKTFTVTEQTKVTVAEGKSTTEVKAAKVADLLKNEAFKIGAAVTVAAGDDGVARAITFGAAAKKKKKEKG